MTTANRQIRLAQRPVGRPDESTWNLTEEPIPTPGDGEFVVTVDYVSLDPAMRGWLNDARSYVPPVGIGEVMRAHAVGRVLESHHPDYAVGEIVSGSFGVTEHALSDGTGVQKVDESVAPAPTWLGALGFPGLTAYFGLMDVGKLTEGDTVVISGAAGAVGSIAGQIAKAKGCTVIGIAGGAEKCAWLTEELGFDAAIDYKNESVYQGLKAAAPKGIDVYFDNVGGEILDAALSRLRKGARVVLCGAISGYNATDPQPGPAHYLSLLINRASMTGFIIFDYLDRFREGIEALSDMLTNGTMTAREQIEIGGITAFGSTLNMLFDGANTGKLVLEVGERTHDSEL
ncbi:putative NADPH: quinone reductase [Rhodococcus sp. AW25M09]|uniref:NADP-dependent oxidoreductase n=1 Tax=Rhodococcus sp. AW25M09 TaxID=1268303 RepID=UPI0002AD0B7A|nr:NADP-dependent oxidoreductase [Rhodococcus sp. AW25M09]CCQ14387.1 putative NADPH: quinone reductase [Rhodococcus sp. AW25M09]